MCECSSFLIGCIIFGLVNVQKRNGAIVYVSGTSKEHLLIKWDEVFWVV